MERGRKPSWNDVEGVSEGEGEGAGAGGESKREGKGEDEDKKLRLRGMVVWKLTLPAIVSET